MVQLGSVPRLDPVIGIVIGLARNYLLAGAPCRVVKVDSCCCFFLPRIRERETEVNRWSGAAELICVGRRMATGARGDDGIPINSIDFTALERESQEVTRGV